MVFLQGPIFYTLYNLHAEVLVAGSQNNCAKNCFFKNYIIYLYTYLELPLYLEYDIAIQHIRFFL